MSSSQSLTADEVYDLLDYNWWVTDSLSPPGGLVNQIQAPSTMLYFKTENGKYGSYQSAGYVDYQRDATDIENYVKNYLMWDAAHVLANSNCIGSITNTQPKDFQVFPIYFK